MSSFTAEALAKLILPIVPDAVLGTASAIELFLTGKTSSPVLMTTRGEFEEAAIRLDGPVYRSTSWSRLHWEEGGDSFYLDGETDDGQTGTFMDRELRFDLRRGIFLDPFDVGSRLRARDFFYSPLSAMEILDAALLASRHEGLIGDVLPVENWPYVGLDDQRFLLDFILQSPFPHLGFDVLQKSGFIETHWPVLEGLNKVDHDKEYHPEGNGWEHVLMALAQTKSAVLTLRMGVLLHDIGKAKSNSSGSNRFDSHAETGAALASRFLFDLEYGKQFISDVCFLVRNHMMPGNLSIMPAYRITNLMSHPLVTLLLDLFKADLSSSFAPMDSYFEACRIYKHYRKLRANPFRKIDPARLMMDQRRRERL
jgi:poly(A) polymerase